MPKEKMIHKNIQKKRLTPIPKARQQKKIQKHQNIPLASDLLYFSERHNLGKMNIECTYCGALYWIDKCITSSSRYHPKFGTCCSHGKVILPYLQNPPHILPYAFTSLGANIDEFILHSHSPYSFHISGELCHLTGSLIPEPNTEAEIQKVLCKYHTFYLLYKQAHKILQAQQNNIRESDLIIYLHFNKSNDQHRYNLPTADEIAIILSSNRSLPELIRDIVLQLQGGQLQRIHEGHSAYLTLHYYSNLHYTPINTQSNRINENNRSKFVVDAWAVTEQNRLRFLHMNQDKLHADVYQGIVDTIGNNTNNNISVNNLGRRIILPSTHIGSINMHKEVPNVVRLALHLPEMHRVVFDPNDSAAAILAHADRQKTTLTSFFETCANLESAQQYTYQEFPQHFVWNKSTKKWSPQKQEFAIGQLYFADPSAGEHFYFRFLLTNIRSPQSFEHLRTVNNIVYPIFKSSKLRILFSILLTQYTPSYPDKLWLCFHNNLCDNLRYKLHKEYAICEPSDDQIYDFGLFLIDEILHQSGQSLNMFSQMPLWKHKWNHSDINYIIAEQLAFDHQKLYDTVNNRIPQLNNEQLSAYHDIYNSVGDGTNTIDNKLTLPDYMKLPYQDLETLINVIYPNIHAAETTDNAIAEKGADNNNTYPIKFLNSLNPSGLPLAKLNLKVGCPIMLLRNIAPGQGLCNGTRLVITCLADRIIEARIICGDHAGELTFIARITLNPSTTELPFTFKRRQFPIRVAYAMTINKSQGQSIKM
ncbi:11109_t:CDS:2 [Scutellospora calospora]|uniref:11109_t:CDS:1 n=1 Tax=Scutellospora calospora TaxID=85575 RepID=A0ACA9LGF1_9GLOM|nr:11109_t:CDS:2 [Scutellospora calospora]